MLENLFQSGRMAHTKITTMELSNANAEWKMDTVGPSRGGME